MLEILIPAGVMGGLGALLAGSLLVAAKKFYVFEDPRIGEIAALLPGANCGGCGKAGCNAFAEAMVGGEEGLRCPVCSTDAMEAIARVMGAVMAAGEPLVAHVMCEGLQSSAQFNGMYAGITDCRAAHLVGQVSRVCSYGCIGLGTCVAACPFDAIDVYDGIAHIIPQKCVACGKCVEACPRDIISLIPKGRRVFVPCKSVDAGKVVTKVCEIGCIGCKKCVKVCPSDAIIFDNNLAAVDQARCTQCNECVLACPRDIIKVRDLAEYVVRAEDLKKGLDHIAAALKTKRAEEQAKAQLAAETGIPAGDKNAEQIAKFRQALADARAKAAADAEFAAKLPAMEQKLLAKLAELGASVDGAALPQAQAPKVDAAAPVSAVDPALQEKYSKMLAALKLAQEKANTDADYAKTKFPEIEAKLQEQINDLEIQLGFTAQAKQEGQA
jgi:Na+-translocating ferredoxin:NAD+ oxidoreductase subunit B